MSDTEVGGSYPHPKKEGVSAYGTIPLEAVIFIRMPYQAPVWRTGRGAEIRHNLRAIPAMIKFNSGRSAINRNQTRHLRVRAVSELASASKLFFIRTAPLTSPAAQIYPHLVPYHFQNSPHFYPYLPQTCFENIPIFIRTRTRHLAGYSGVLGRPTHFPSRQSP